MKDNKRFTLWKVVRNTIFFLLSIILIWKIIHQAVTIYEHNKYPPVGELIEVDGKKMHVFTKGEGQNTIVLLSGLGTAAPVLDFEPLVNELAKHHKVIVVELFVYGWSELTDEERTVENIVEEIRSALKKSNSKGPYVLMPHSVSGIYSLYYASQYPDEVEAIIGIDSTLPEAVDYFEEPALTLPKPLKYIAPIGVARALVYVTPASFLPLADKGMYSNENLQLTKPTIVMWLMKQ